MLRRILVSGSVAGTLLVVVGGTGQYAGVDGVQTQTLIGFNNAELVIDDVPFFGLAWTTDLPTG